MCGTGGFSTLAGGGGVGGGASGGFAHPPKAPMRITTAAILKCIGFIP